MKNVCFVVKEILKFPYFERLEKRERLQGNSKQTFPVVITML